MDNKSDISRESAEHFVWPGSRLPAPRYEPPIFDPLIGERSASEVKISESSSILVKIRREGGRERWEVKWPPQMSKWRKWHWRTRLLWWRRPRNWRELRWWILAELFNLAERAGLAKWVGREITGPTAGVGPFRDWVENAVRPAIRNGLLVFNPPIEMRQGVPSRVEVGVVRSAALRDVLLDGLRGQGMPEVKEIETSAFMTVELKGDAFKITSYSSPEQVVAPAARWEFDVLPVKAREQTLFLCVSLRLATPKLERLGEARRSVAVAEKTIQVRMNAPYSTQRFAMNNWQWLVATVIALGGSLGTWLALLH